MTVRSYVEQVPVHMETLPNSLKGGITALTASINEPPLGEK